MIKLGNTVIFDIKEVAVKFNLTTTTIRRYIKEGRLKGQKMGNRWYISEDAIAEFFMQSYFRPKREK
jgi:excisionase family DNA binding protein